MDDQIFETLLRATEELEWTAENSSLARTRDVYNQKLYFVAFIGQYSAGKSCLINNLLNRELLPKGITETTPLLTYIRYGDREQAKLHYLDGAVQVLEVKQVASLIQKKNSDWDLEKLDYLEIFLPEEMLRQGMVLLDTPGINTLIQRHEQLLASSLAMAANIIYVTGRAPTKVDVDELTMLTVQGFDVSFVRTHCDEIRASEESDEDVVRADQELMAKCGIDSVSCYHVSNVDNSHWFQAIGPLRRMLEQKGERSTQELEQAAARQMSVLAQRCANALEEKQRLLSAAHSHNTQELERRRGELKRQMEALQGEIDRRQGQLQDNIKQCQRTLEGPAARESEELLNQAVQHIRTSGNEVATEEQMSMLMRRETEQLARGVYETINSRIDPLVEEINGEFDLNGLTVDQMELPQADSYTQLRGEQDVELEQLRERLSALRSDRARIETELQDMEETPEFQRLAQELKELESALSAAQREYGGIPPYTPQLIEVEDHRLQPSQIAKAIGTMADWALLLVPGANIGSAVAGLADSSKVVNGIAKMLGSSQKIVDIFKRGDTIKDTIFALQNMSKTYATVKRKSKAVELIGKAAKGASTAQSIIKENAPASFLDYFTVQHWAEQIGKNFDRPPKMVVDTEYEKAYRAQKSLLEEQQRELQRQTYQKKLELKVFRSEKEQLDAEKASMVLDEGEVEAKLRKLENEIRLSAQKRALACWKEQCATWYHEQLMPQIKASIQNYLSELPQRLGSYQDRRTQAIMARLEKQRTAYDEMSAASPDEIEQSLERVSALLEQVKLCV